MSQTEITSMKTRRTHGKEFKAQVLEQCVHPNASIASVAQEHGLNANLVHKWLRQARQSSSAAREFVPLALPAAMTVADKHIEIELVRGQARATIRWPVCAAASCMTWLQAWLR